MKVHLDLEYLELNEAEALFGKKTKTLCGIDPEGRGLNSPEVCIRVEEFEKRWTEDDRCKKCMKALKKLQDERETSEQTSDS